MIYWSTILFISGAFAALQSFAAHKYATIWLSQQLQSISQPFKTRNCVSPHLFHPRLLKDRGCLVFLSCFLPLALILTSSSVSG